MIIFEKVSQGEFLTNLYDSDKHGYSIVTLCQSIYHIDGPFLLMFYCNDEKIFAILLEGKLLDSAKPCRSIFIKSYSDPTGKKNLNDTRY